MRIEATSRPVTKDDEKKRDLAFEILRQSNVPSVDFAKLMVPTSLSTIGVTLALLKDWSSPDTSGPPGRAWVVTSCLLALASTLIFATAAYARRVRISLADYEDVINEVLRAAESRRRLITVGLLILVLSILLAALVLTS
jgi:MFS family permease